MDSKQGLQEAKDSIMRALECELGGHILEARMLYEESIKKLHATSLKEASPKMLDTYNKYMSSYENHVQRLRDQIAQHMFGRRMVERIIISEGSRGHSYEKLFGCYLNNTVPLVHIYEPKLTDSSQLENLLHFVEVVVKRCPNLVFVRLITCPHTAGIKLQATALDELREELACGNITFNYQFDPKLEEPRIIMGNGILIKSSLGLHIYKHLSSCFKLGLCDYDFRRCVSATIDIYKTKAFSEHITKADKSEIMETMAAFSEQH